MESAQLPILAPAILDGLWIGAVPSVTLIALNLVWTETALLQKSAVAKKVTLRPQDLVDINVSPSALVNKFLVLKTWNLETNFQMDAKMECAQLQTSASVIQALWKSLKEATIALDVSDDLRWLICTWSWFQKKF